MAVTNRPTLTVPNMDKPTVAARPTHGATPLPLGVFRAVSTRDHGALTRDGAPYYDIEHIRDEPEGSLYEVRFADGEWMLASFHDLDPSPDGATTLAHTRGESPGVTTIPATHVTGSHLP